MDDFKITDLLPRESEFYLSILDKTFYLRPCTPKDIIDLNTRGLKVEEILANPISADVCKIGLYLMQYESAKEFKKITVKTINIETGEEEVEELGGYNLLLKFIANVKEQMDLFFCLLGSMGFTKKHIDELKDATFKGMSSKEFNDKVKDKVKKKVRKQAKIRKKKIA